MVNFSDEAGTKTTRLTERYIKIRDVTQYFEIKFSRPKVKKNIFLVNDFRKCKFNYLNCSLVKKFN